MFSISGEALPVYQAYIRSDISPINGNDQSKRIERFAWKLLCLVSIDLTRFTHEDFIDNVEPGQHTEDKHRP